MLTRGEIDAERVSLTVDELLDCEPRQLVEAFAMARRECVFFPTPAELFEFMNRERLDIRKPGPGPCGCDCDECMARYYQRPN